jgi:hypothetical protein
MRTRLIFCDSDCVDRSAADAWGNALERLATVNDIMARAVDNLLMHKEYIGKMLMFSRIVVATSRLHPEPRAGKTKTEKPAQHTRQQVTQHNPGAWKLVDH